MKSEPASTFRGNRHQRWVVFDPIGVLAGPSWRDIVDTPDSEAWRRFRVGAIGESEFWGPADASRYREVLAFRPEPLQLLARLRSAGYQICLATNFYRGWLEVLASDREAPPFDAVLVSSDIGAAKPEPGFWERLLDHVPSGTLFVDDQQADCEGAAAAGLRALWAQPRIDLSAALSDMLLEGRSCIRS